MKKKSVKSFFISFFIHIFFLFFCLYTNVFSFSSHIKPQEEIVILEMVNISDTVNVKTQSIQKDKEIKNDEAKNVKNTKTLATEEPKKEEVKKDEKVKNDDPNKLKFNTKKESEKTKKDESKKDDKKETKIDKTKKEEKIDKKKEKDKDKTIDDLMKQLEKESQGKNPTSKNRKIEKSDAKSDSIGNNNFDQEKAQSISDQEYMNSKISKYWNKIGIENESGRIRVRIKLNIDGSLESISEVDAPSDIIKSSIIRAIKMAAPYDKLSVDRYDSWAEMEIEFDFK